MRTESSPNSTRKPAPADKIWQSKLREIPTVFGKLVFLGSLLDASGAYRDETLYGLLGAEEAERAIRHSHYQVFSRWLSFTLFEQRQDLREFLGGFGSSSIATPTTCPRISISEGYRKTAGVFCEAG